MKNPRNWLNAMACLGVSHNHATLPVVSHRVSTKDARTLVPIGRTL